MALHPIPLPCALAFPPPIHWDATTPSPCWTPHSITQEHIMFWNPTPSEPRLSPAATMSDDTLSRLSLRLCTAPLSCSLQPLLKLLPLNISATICLNRFTFADSWKVWSLNLCVFSYLFLFCLCFSYSNSLQLLVPVCNLVVITTAIPLILLPWYSFLAVSEILLH